MTMTRVPEVSAAAEPNKDVAWTEFLRMMRWIAVAGVAMVGGVLVFLSFNAPLNAVTIIATVGGVFVSMLLGCGLFAAAFFSAKSGHDDTVTWATGGRRERSENSL